VVAVSLVSVALVTMSTGAFFTSFIEPFFFKRKIKGIEIILGLMVIIGLYIIFSFESQYTLGIIYALISSFLSALFSVLNGLFVKTYNASLISFYQLFFGAFFITIFLLIQGSFSLDFFILPNSDWIYLLLLSSVCTAYAFIVSVDVMKHLTPYTVMLTINLEPVYAIILALIVFGETEEMNSEFYLGACIVLFVVVLNGVLKNMKSIVKKVGKYKPSKK
jgi:drug/metabolite transporter (DMT)-like permease